MKPRTRPLKDLYFRFIEGTEHAGVLDWNHAADALQRAGLIDLIPHRERWTFEHYRDTSKMHNMSPEHIHEILRQYAIDLGLV